MDFVHSHSNADLCKVFSAIYISESLDFRLLDQNEVKRFNSNSLTSDNKHHSTHQGIIFKTLSSACDSVSLILHRMNK